MNGMKQEENHRSLLGYKTARWCTHGDLTALVLLGIQFSNGDMIAYIYQSFHNILHIFVKSFKGDMYVNTSSSKMCS